MGRFLLDVAEDGADAADRNLGNRYRGARRPELRADVELTADGYEGRIEAHGSLWHLDEFGSINNEARPYLRPGAQEAVARHGGRLGGA